MNDLQPEKKTIYRPTNEVGIRSIWDWSDKASNYVKRSRGNRFQAYIEKNKKTRSASFSSIEEAVRWRLRLQADFDRLPDFDPLNFQQLVKKFLEKKKQNICITTFESYQSLTKHLKFFNSFMVEDINSKTVDRWLELVTSTKYRETEHVKPVRFSYMKELEVLTLIFTFYREYINEKFTQPILNRHFDDSIFKRDVYEKRKLDSQLRYIDGPEIERLLSVFANQVSSKPDKHLYYVSCLMQLRTGMRIGEVSAIRWEEIDWNSGHFTIDKTIWWGRSKKRPSIVGSAPKNRKGRVILLSPEVLLELRKLQKHQSRIHGLIFSSDGTKINGYSSILHHYNYAMAEAKVDFTATHIMRHTFATDFRASGFDRGGALQGIMGHSSEKMTAKYAKITDPTVLRGLQEYGESKSRNREQIAP